VDEADRVVDEVLAEVVTVGHALWSLDAVIVVREVRCELIGLAVEESVVAIEPRCSGHWSNGPAEDEFSIDTRCHLPTANVVYPYSRKTSAIVAAWFEICPRMLGKPVLQFDSPRIPTL